MLTPFDWLRRSVSGAELIATLKTLETEPGLLLPEGDPGPPHSALRGPCARCWLHPPHNPKENPYCSFCQAVVARASLMGKLARTSMVIWCHFSQLPKFLHSRSGFYKDHLEGVYLHDEHHFLLVMRRRHLKRWLQELIFYHGTDIQGLIQILPTVGKGIPLSMGDLLVRAINHEARFSLDQLRVRFYPAPHHVIKPHLRDNLGLLTFDITSFISLLEMATVFRSILLPETQEILFTLLNLRDPEEEGFYWGRFLGMLTPKAKDMLNAWRIRQWPRQRVKLLYELTEYVEFSPAH